MKLSTKVVLLLSVFLITILGYLFLYPTSNYSYKKDAEDDCIQLIKSHEQASAEGNKNSQTSLGLYYLHGRCVKKDDKKAFDYFSQAATDGDISGDANGQNNLGVSYVLGIGVHQDPEQAVIWFKKSAEQGWSEAQFNLGVCYSLGIGVPKDITLAKKWFLKSSKRGVNAVYDARIEEMAIPFLEGIVSPDEIIWIRNWKDIGF